MLADVEKFVDPNLSPLAEAVNPERLITELFIFGSFVLELYVVSVPAAPAKSNVKIAWPQLFEKETIIKNNQTVFTEPGTLYFFVSNFRILIHSDESY